MSIFADDPPPKMDIEYDQKYSFLYSPIGAGRVLELYDGMIKMAMQICDAIIAIDTMTGLVDITPQDVLQLGPVPDPAGNQYLGCRFVFHILEYGPNG